MKEDQSLKNGVSRHKASSGRDLTNLTELIDLTRPFVETCFDRCLLLSCNLSRSMKKSFLANCETFTFRFLERSTNLAKKLFFFLRFCGT